jgi:hypothetical protein
VLVCVGGPPPISFVRASSAALAANYPGRLGLALAYPAPPMWASALMQSIAAFLPSTMASRLQICHTERQLKALTKLDPLYPGTDANPLLVQRLRAVSPRSHLLVAPSMLLS